MAGGPILFDGGTVVELPVAPPLPQMPPPPPPPIVSAPSIPILPPGQVYFDVGDGSFIGSTTGQIVSSPPVSDISPPLDDFAQADADAYANNPDLSWLPDWEFDDPFATRSLEAANPPLKGDAAAEAITEACAKYHIDDHACFANALSEGWQGTVGDGGEAYGPFQDWLTHFPGRPFYGKGLNNDTVNAWAWSRNGIFYSVRHMALGPPSAAGLVGHAAVHAIVYGYEKPGDKPGTARDRDALYDRLVAMGTGELAYVASQLHGPVSGGATGKIVIPPSTPPPAAYVPAGINAQWRDLVGVFGTAVPAEHSKVQSFGLTLKDVFK